MEFRSKFSPSRIEFIKEIQIPLSKMEFGHGVGDPFDIKLKNRIKQAKENFPEDMKIIAKKDLQDHLPSISDIKVVELTNDKYKVIDGNGRIYVLKQIFKDIMVDVSLYKLKDRIMEQFEDDPFGEESRFGLKLDLNSVKNVISTMEFKRVGEIEDEFDWEYFEFVVPHPQKGDIIFAVVKEKYKADDELYIISNRPGSHHVYLTSPSEEQIRNAIKEIISQLGDESEIIVEQFEDDPFGEETDGVPDIDLENYRKTIISTGLPKYVSNIEYGEFFFIVDYPNRGDLDFVIIKDYDNGIISIILDEDSIELKSSDFEILMNAITDLAEKN